MSGPRRDAAVVTWRIPGFSRVIEFPQPLLSEIVARVVVGFWRAPRGGVEVGGVLFGEVSEGVLRVVSSRPIECAHALGPAFALTEEENEKLATFLRFYRNDPELRGLTPVGWWHSHTREGLRLDPGDLELHTRHFPEAWQFTFLLQPREGKPTRGAVFVRGAEGALGAEPARRLDDPSASDAPEALREEVGPPRPARNEARRPTPAAEARAPERPADDAEVSLPFRHYLEQESRRGFGAAWKWLGAGLAGAAVLAGLALGVRRLDRPEQRAKLQAATDRLSDYWRRVIRYWSGSWEPDLPRLARLEILRLEGITQMRWTAEATADTAPEATAALNALQVRWLVDEGLAGRATGAVLEIADGSERRSFPITGDGLRAGARIHFAGSEEVTARLEVARPFGPPVVATARYATPQRTEAESEAEALREEVDRLEMALQLKRSETASLNNTLASIRQYARLLAEEAAKAAPPPTLVEKRPTGAPAAAALVERRPELGPAARAPAYTGQPSGRIIWTGSLGQNEVLTLEGGRPSAGRVSGRLPGAPVRVRVYPAEFSAGGLTVFSDDPRHSGGLAEAPGLVNQFTRTTFVYAPARAQAVEVVEPPAPRNGWSRMSIRVTHAGVSVIFIEWSR